MLLARCCRLIYSHPRLSYSLSTSQYGKSKPYYVTTPIFYPNAPPHIGHLASMVSADVFARFRRLTHPESPVYFLTGTDDHGLKIQKAAAAAGLAGNEEEFVGRVSKVFHELADEAQISYTTFMRTTREEHYRAVQHVWRALDAQGLIYKGDYAGWYSVTDECFYTDAQVTHIPGDSNTPPRVISTETGAQVEWSSETNYMFRLSTFREALLEQYTNNPATQDRMGDASRVGIEGDEGTAALIIPAQHLSSIVADLSPISETTLEDLSISRPRSRLSWGVPVPGDEDHTVYVWFDALLVYLSGIGYPWTNCSPNEAGWPPDLQIIGKDILRFHALYLPAILHALQLPHAKQLLAHAHWTVEGRKMSKSVGNVADPREAIREYGVDAVRFYLVRIGGRWRDDVDWSRAQLDKHSKEIQSLLGNYFLRVASPRILETAQRAPQISIEDILKSIPTIVRSTSANSETFVPGNPEHPLLPLVALDASQRSLGSKVYACLVRHDLSDALDAIITHLRLANRTITLLEPWAARGPVGADAEDVANKEVEVEHASRAYATHVTALESLRVVGICLLSVLPGAAGRLLDALGVPSERRVWDAIEKDRGTLNAGVKGVRVF